MSNTSNTPFPNGEQNNQGSPLPPDPWNSVPPNQVNQPVQQQTGADTSYNTAPQTSADASYNTAPQNTAPEQNYNGYNMGFGYADPNSYQSQTQAFSEQMPPNQQQYSQPYQGQPMYNPQPMQPTEEKVSVGFAILSYFVPIAGLIIYLTMKDSRPKTAKVSGKCAIASVVINVVISILVWVIIFFGLGAGLAGAASSMDDTSDTGYYDSFNYDEYDTSDEDLFTDDAEDTGIEDSSLDDTASGYLETEEMTYSMAVGDKQQIDVTSIPDGYSIEDVTFESSNTDAVTVASDGTMTAANVGSAIVTVATNDGEFSTSCYITVLD